MSEWDQFAPVNGTQPQRQPTRPQGGGVILSDPNADIERRSREQSMGNDAVRTDIAVQGQAFNQADSDRNYGRRVADSDRDYVRQLRTDFQRSEPVANYRTIVEQYANAIRSAPNAGGDINLIYAFSKIMDPGSVVRESEAEMAGNTANRLSSLAAQFNFEMGEGGRLAPEARARLLRELHSRTVVAARSYMQARNDAAQNVPQGVDPRSVLGAPAGAPFNEEIRQFLVANPSASSIPIDQGTGGGVTPPDGVFMTGEEQLGAAMRDTAPGGAQRLSPEQETNWNQFVRQNAGRMTPELANQWYAQNAPGWTVDFNSDHGMRWINALNNGQPTSNSVNYQVADEQYQQQLDAEIARRVASGQAFVDATGGDLGRFIPGYDQQSYSDARTNLEAGLSQSLGDEFAGIGGALSAGFTGGNNIPQGMSAYEWERDISRRANEAAMGRQGAMGTVANIAGSLMTAPFIPGAQLRSGMTAGQLARAGGIAGAVNGFGAGDGAAGSAAGAVAGAALGAGAGYGAGRLGERIAARASVPANAADRQAFLAAAERNPEVNYLAADIPGNFAGGLATGVIDRGLGAIPLNQARNVANQSLDDLASRSAQNVGAVSDNAGAGEAAQQGARIWMRESQARASTLEDAIPINRNAPAQLVNTRNALANVNNAVSSNSELSALLRDPRLSAYQQALEGGDLSWGDLRQFRSIIGEMQGGQRLQSDTRHSSLSALYGALTSDLEATAAQISPRALTAFRRAVQFERGRFGRIEEVMRPLLGRDGHTMSGEAAFNRINAWAGERSGDHSRLARLIRSLPEDESGQVRATIIDTLGDANNSAQNGAGTAFSPETFLTRWNGMSDRAKSILFQGEHRQALDDIAAFSTGRRMSRVFGNPSGTGYTTVAAAHGGVLLANPIAGAMLALADFGSGALLGSPRFARWMAALARKPNQAAANAHIRRLATVARAEPAIANDIIGLQARLQDWVAQSPTRAAAQGQEENNGR